MKVILISGKAQAGKDTAANEFKRLYERDGLRVCIFHYADLLKFYASQYFGWDGMKDEYGRTLLQHIGSDIVRAERPSYWVNHAVNFINVFNKEFDVMIIPDVRFKNEIEHLVFHAKRAQHYCPGPDHQFYYIRVTRPGYNNGLTEQQKRHVSETELDGYVPSPNVVDESFELINNGRLSKYAKDIDNIRQYIAALEYYKQEDRSAHGMR